MSDRAALLILPYPPPTNHLYATVRGRRVLSKRGRDYKEEAGWLALTARLERHSGPVAVTVRLYRPQRTGDVDGALKVLLDSLTGILYNDDSQVEELHAYRYDDKANPRAEVVVEALAAEGGAK